MKRVLTVIIALICSFFLFACSLNETYNSKNNPLEPDVSQLLDEAYGNAAATKMIFDFAEEIGYLPSDVFGPYCFDMRTHVIHHTNSACIEQIPFESRMSCWVYDCYTLQSVKRKVKENQFLSKFDWEICPICIP